MNLNSFNIEKLYYGLLVLRSYVQYEYRKWSIF